jgi:hypothetical protein
MTWSREEKLMWFLWWPLSTGSLVGFGMLGPGGHPWTGWGDALTGGVVVLCAIAMGLLLGMQIQRSVTGKMTKWAVSAQTLYDQEVESHDRTADALFDLAYGLTSPAVAQSYLEELDRFDDEEDDESPTEPH